MHLTLHNLYVALNLRLSSSFLSLMVQNNKKKAGKTGNEASGNNETSQVIKSVCSQAYGIINYRLWHN